MAEQIPHDDESNGRERAEGMGQARAGAAAPDAEETRLNEYDVRLHELYRDEKLIGRGRRGLNGGQEKIYRREGLVFPYLARSLSLKVHELDHYFRFNGLPADIIIFCLLMRAYYHQLSARRLQFELERARREGLISEIPMPNTVLYHQRQIYLTPLLEHLTGIAALPFRNFDRAFAVDATKNFTEVYLEDKDGNVMERDGRKLNKWIKLHLMNVSST